MVKLSHTRLTLEVLRNHSILRQTLAWAAFTLLAWLLAVLPLLSLFALLAAAAALFLLLRRPWLIWLGIAAALPVTSGIKTGPLSLTDLALAGAFVLWFLDGVRRRSLPLYSSVVTIALLGYLAALAFSMLQAIHLGEAAVEVIKWGEFLAILLLVRSMMPADKAPWLVLALLIGGICQAVFGLYQFIFNIGPEWFVILGRFMRASGSFQQPNPYAGYLGLTLPVAASLALWAWRAAIREPDSRRTPDGNDWARIIGGWRPIVWAVVYTIATVLIAIGLFASWSRGGWLGAAAGLTTVLVMRSRQALFAGMLLLLMVLGVLLGGTSTPAFIPPAVAARLLDVRAVLDIGDVLSEPVTDENFSVIERVAHWVAALRMWEQAPWLGVGPGNYAIAYPAVRIPQWEDPLGHAHNIYLNTLGETGMVGLTMFLYFWGVSLLWVWRQARQAHKQDATWWSALAIGVFGVLVHLKVHNFFDNLFVQGMYLHVALWLAVLHLPGTHSQHSSIRPGNNAGAEFSG